MTKLSKSTTILPLAVALLLMSSSVQAASSKCYAIAFSSGQENAAFQAGALKGIISKLPAEEVQYTSVTGISGGAVNAAILSSFAKGEESAAVDRMINFWKDAADSKLYQNWWGGVITGLFSAGGIYDNSPLYDFLTKEFQTHMDIKRDLAIGITDVLSG